MSIAPITHKPIASGRKQLSDWRQGIRRQSRLYRRYLLPAIFCCSSAACMSVALAATYDSVWSKALASGSIGLWIVFLLLGIVVNSQLSVAIKQMAYRSGKGDIGLLAELLRTNIDPQSSTFQAVRYALIKQLQNMEAGDYDLLNPAQRRRLYRELTGLDTRLILTILHALGRIGDTKALPYVERLAIGKGRAAADQRVEAAAQVCLVALKERIVQMNHPQTLLRAVGVSEENPDALLRPIPTTTPAQTDQLLRVSHDQDFSA